MGDLQQAAGAINGIDVRWVVDALRQDFDRRGLRVGSARLGHHAQFRSQAKALPPLSQCAKCGKTVFVLSKKVNIPLLGQCLAERIHVPVHLLCEPESILLCIVRVKSEDVKTQAFELLDVEPAHFVALLIIDDRIPCEHGYTPGAQVFADDAQILDVFNTKNEHRCVRRDGRQCLQVGLRKRAEARQWKGTPRSHGFQDGIPK